jgi:hypothetical protein
MSETPDHVQCKHVSHRPRFAPPRLDKQRAILFEVRQIIPKLVADGKIGHPLVVVALYHFDLWQRRIKKL